MRVTKSALESAFLAFHNIADSLDGFSHLNGKFLFNILQPPFEESIISKWRRDGLDSRFARETSL